MAISNSKAAPASAQTRQLRRPSLGSSILSATDGVLERVVNGGLGRLGKSSPGGRLDDQLRRDV